MQASGIPGAKARPLSVRSVCARQRMLVQTSIENGKDSECFVTSLWFINLLQEFKPPLGATRALPLAIDELRQW